MDMAADEHNFLVELLERHPDVIRGVLEVLRLPPLAEGETPFSHGSHMPMRSIEHEPDNVIGIHAGSPGERRRVVRGYVLETQRSRDLGKDLTWPLYVQRRVSYFGARMSI